MKNILLILLVIVHETANAEDMDSEFNDCITWRDDLVAVTLSCRVPNLSSPVIFYHNETKTEVKCYYNKKLFCTPVEKITNIEHFAQTVTIILVEKKAGRNLDGKWYCKHGKTTHSTTVSVKKGIKSDSWVKIHGRIIQLDNDTISIKVECSSCRKPHERITEFLVNGKTLASVWQDDNGSCIHKSLVCEADVCNCTDTGNQFSLTIQRPNNDVATEFACVMQFEDKIRNGRFSKTASMTFTDGDFIDKQSKLKYIKENEPIPTPKVITNIVDESNNHEVNGKSPKTPSNQGNEMLIIVSISSACGPVLIIIICGVIIIRKHKYNRMNKKGEITENVSTKTPLIKAQMCKGCSDNIDFTRAEYMCFDCREIFCNNCQDQFHKTMKLQYHKCAELKFVPKTFTLSIFHCSLEDHDESLLDCICYSHNHLVCKTCRTDIHSTCQTEAIAHMSLDKFDKLVTEYQSDLDSTEETLVSFCNYLKRSLVSTERHMSRTMEKIKSSIQTNYKLISLDHCMKNLPKDKLTNHLESIIRNVRKAGSECTTKTKAIKKSIKEEKEKFDFLSNYGGSHHILALTVCGTKRLEIIKSELSSLKISFEECHISIGLENNTICIGKRKRDDIQPSTESTTPSVASDISVGIHQSEEILESAKELCHPVRPMAKIPPNKECINEPSINLIEIGKEETTPLIPFNEPVTETSADSAC